MAVCCERLRNTSTDTRLRMTLVGLYVLTLTFTLMTCLSLGWSSRILNGCPLYANLQLSLGSANNTILLGEGTTWGDNVKCDFCVFAAVCGGIIAIMWFWFYLLLSNFRAEDKHGVRVPPDTSLLLPSMVANVPMVVIALVVACMISDGRSHLCAQIRMSIGDDCDLAGQREWRYPVDGRQAFNYIRVAQYGAWFWFFSVMATIVVGTFRVRRFLQDGGQHGAKFLTSRSTSTSSLTSSEDFYSTSDSDLEEDNVGFNNPNYEQGSEVVKMYPGGGGQRLERVDEEDADRGGKGPGVPYPGGPAEGTLPSLGGPPGSTVPSLGGPPGSTLPSLGGPPGSTLPSLGGPPGSTVPSLGGPPGSTLPSLGGPPGATLPSLGGSTGGRLPPLHIDRREGDQQGAAQVVKKDKSERHKAKKATT